MRTRPGLLDAWLGDEYFETIERYIANAADYQDLILQDAPPGWRFVQQGVWYYAFPEEARLAPQGWKIHVSASTHTAPEALAACLPTLWRTRVHFKCSADRRILSLMNSKTWNRGGSGKFLTIYPPDDATFTLLIEDIYNATQGLYGPYILSDKRYKDSRVVFYRYGGFERASELTIRGSQIPTIKNREGASVPDVRTPYFSKPDWVADPIATFKTDADRGETRTLKSGRYFIQRALTFSNSGGVYVAEDRTTGDTVIIKEARPRVSWTSATDDAVALLKKEYAILEDLAGDGFAAKPLDLFQDWEHWFLVEEFIDGTSLWDLAALESILLRVSPRQKDVQDAYERFCELFTQVCTITQSINAKGIVLADLSPRNVLVEKSGRVRFIDFEAAWKIGRDVPTHMSTPGFAAPSRGALSDFSGDDYSVAAMALSYIFRATEFISFYPQGVERTVKEICGDAGIPIEVADCIAGGLCPDEAKRTPHASLHDSLLKAPFSWKGPTDPRSDATSIRKLLDGTLEFISQSADPSRQDRLFPADYRLFSTNPLGLAYGACGTLWALQRLGVSPRQEWLAWLERADVKAESYAPGWGVGLAGIAWTLLDLGWDERARRIMEMARKHPLLLASPNFFYGLAGWGMTNLKFFYDTRDECYLAEARLTAARLLSSSEERDGNLYWTQDGLVPLGLQYGGAGIALFLLHAYLATHEDQFMDAGIRALDHELSNAVETADGGLTWNYVANAGGIVSPYWDRGTAGVGAVVLRYACVRQDVPRYRTLLEKITVDARRKYTYNVSKLCGLAGIAGFHMDAYQLLSDENHLRDARRAFDGISLYRMERENGTIALPGSEQNKISCDYGMGMAGVAIAAHRYLNGDYSEFMLDEALSPGRETVPPDLAYL